MLTKLGALAAWSSAVVTVVLLCACSESATSNGAENSGGGGSGGSSGSGGGEASGGGMGGFGATQSAGSANGGASLGGSANAGAAGVSESGAPGTAGTSGASTGGAGASGGGASASASKLDFGLLPDNDNAKSNTKGLTGFIARTGVIPVVVSNYMNITNGAFDSTGAQSFMAAALAAGVKRVSISLATADADVSAAAQSQIAAAVSYGQKAGVTVQVRFGYEMNGNWSPSYHGGDPSIFKSTWTEVASAVHGAGGQMVWAPNVVAGGISPYASVLPDDTSTIDVIGLDMYHFNSNATNLSIGASEVDTAFATIYSLVKQLNKPFILSETAVSYFDDSGTWATATPAEVTEKQQWLEQLTSSSLVAKYPLYRGFTWFDYNKLESSQYRDFSISQDPLEAAMFSTWVAENRSALNLGG